MKTPFSTFSGVVWTGTEYIPGVSVMITICNRVIIKQFVFLIGTFWACMLSNCSVIMGCTVTSAQFDELLSHYN